MHSFSPCSCLWVKCAQQSQPVILHSHGMQPERELKSALSSLSGFFFPEWLLARVFYHSYRSAARIRGFWGSNSTPMLEGQTLSRPSCLPSFLFLLRTGVLCASVGCLCLTDLGSGLHINRAELSIQFPLLDCSRVAAPRGTGVAFYSPDAARS